MTLKHSEAIEAIDTFAKVVKKFVDSMPSIDEEEACKEEVEIRYDSEGYGNVIASNFVSGKPFKNFGHKVEETKHFANLHAQGFISQKCAEEQIKEVWR